MDIETSWTSSCHVYLKISKRCRMDISDGARVQPSGRRPRLLGLLRLPVLHGDRPVARVDAGADRRAGVLRVAALHVAAGAGDEAVETARLGAHGE
jgi:hypothetical protein